MAECESSDCRGNVRELARREFLLRAGRWCAGLVALALIGGGAYGAYGIWRNRHLEQQATQFASRGDVQSAVLVARRLLEFDKQNVTASRVMADLAERAGRAEALEWRKSVAALQPLDSDNQLALAATALRFGQAELANHALEAVDKSLRETSRWHQLAGGAALARGQTDAAEEHFSAALKEEPENHGTALSLATIRLASRKAATAETARGDLRQLAAASDVRAPALRALAADALAHNDRAVAQNWTASLLAENAPSFADQLLHLEATIGSPAATDAMARCQTTAARNSALAAQLITWMNRHEQAQEALTWSGSLPDAVRNAQPVPLAIAESLSCRRDWTALADFVHGKNWGEQEPLRLAVESHATRHLGNGDTSTTEAQTLWRAAMKAAQSRPEHLAAIAKLAEGWGYRAEAAEVWWLLANGTTGAKEALAALQNLYKNTSDSRGLLRVAKRALELNPADLVAANNCASLGVLLQGDAGSRRLAEKLYNEHPLSAAFAATYAFALHSEGKSADALRVIERLKETQLRQPALAAYYVMMLADTGNVERARAFLPAAEHAALLPEEQTLLANAARKLAGS